MFEQARTMRALLLGRKTYDIFAAYWPRASAENPFTDLLNRIPKYVVSRKPAGALAWRNSSRLTGDLTANVDALMERHGEVHVIGSLELVRSLLRLGLVDRFHLWLYPLLLGHGKRVFGDGTVPTSLRLAEFEAYANGTIELTYETAGVPSYGDVATSTDSLAGARPD
jgi:dihydrofolate reductase